MKKITLFLALILINSFAQAKDSKKPACEEIPEDQRGISFEQRELNYGYATIYSGFKAFKWLEIIMDVKTERQDVHDLVTDMHETGKRIATKFEEFQKTYPNLRLDEKGRRNFTEIKTKAQTKDRIESYLPLVGKKGEDFERSVVLFSSQVTNELKYLSYAVGETEPNESMKKFTKEIHDESERLETRANKLLNERYFKHNLMTKKDSNKKDDKDSDKKKESKKN